MRILIAEDERITRRALQRQLERWDYHPVAVENGVQAWEQFQRQQFDIVVTDWDMPQMDGRELVRRIRAKRWSSYAYLIMLTGRRETTDLVAGMDAGADDFLSKPFNRNELRVRLRAGERIIQLKQELSEQNQALSKANERMSSDLEEKEILLGEIRRYSQEMEITLEELKESQTALVQAEKIASLGRLVAGVAHEINTPLGVLRSTANMIQRAVAKVHERLRGQSGEAFDKVMPLFELLTSTSAPAQDACDRINRIVKNLRLFAQLDRDEFQRVQIHAGIESTLRLLRHEFGERIEVSTEFGDVPEIHCSPRELNQLFMNLLLNATESMEESGHGQIRIRTWTVGG